MLLSETLNTLPLYSGLFSIMELRKASWIEAVKGPLFASLNTVELTVTTYLSFLLSKLFPTSKGPKSNVFYPCTNTFDR